MSPRRYAAFAHYDDWTDQINNEELIDYINREMRPLNIYFSDADIRDALDELRDAAGSGDYSREDRLVKVLKKKQLNKDQESNGSQGLHRSRGRFLIFSFVAHRLESEELASALLRFFNREAHKIEEDEKSFMMTEWGLGLSKLEGLVPQDKLNKAFTRVASRGPPMFEEWRRPGPYPPRIADSIKRLYEPFLHDHGGGRDRLQLITSPMRRPSLSAFRRPSMIELPPFPRTGYSSPIITPRHELNTLHLRQHMHDFELHRLRRDIDDLKYRY